MDAFLARDAAQDLQTMKRIFLFLSALASLLLFSCVDFQDVQCTGVRGFRVNRIGMEGIDADLILGIKNPNAFGFTIHKSEFDVKYSGINLGKARLTKKVRVNGNTEGDYSFNLNGDFRNLNVMDVMKLLNGASFKSVIEVKGNLNVGKLFVKKQIPVDIKEKISLN